LQHRQGLQRVSRTGQRAQERAAPNKPLSTPVPFQNRDQPVA
jgi:hypothetical protein